jgi:hypothetical protein
VSIIAVLLVTIPTTAVFAQSDNQQQPTCSDGSQPDSIGNCPTQQQQQQPLTSGTAQKKHTIM